MAADGSRDRQTDSDDRRTARRKVVVGRAGGLGLRSLPDRHADVLRLAEESRDLVAGIILEWVAGGEPGGGTRRCAAWGIGCGTCARPSPTTRRSTSA
jgi:hypothetical protein